ncbi:ABC transporter substrate binding protein [Rhodoplanes sp. Z2-YC6860]|nr:ABC transporter substrate binding protein [Rhodoplanes sp. Z2-YC6860]
MRRRELLGLIIGGAVAWPSCTFAQPPTQPVIGFLHSGSPGPTSNYVTAFRAGLGETGFIAGGNVAMEHLWAEDQFDRLPALAKELVQHKVSLIRARCL